MKTKTVSLSLGVLCVVVSGTLATNVVANDAFDRMDSNGDGFLKADEFAEEKLPLFERLLRTSDTNKDGKLDLKEFSTGIAPEPATPETDRRTDRTTDRPGEMRRPTNPGEFFDRLDRNGDGKLQVDELPAQFAERMQRADLNRDGVIEKAELERVRKMAMGGGNTGNTGPTNTAGGLVGRTLDIDGDGELSVAEIAAASRSLAKLDRNNDGDISRAELYSRVTAGPATRPTNPQAIAEQLKRADRNNDGKLSREEAPPKLAEAFDRVDRNGDGFIDGTEIKAVLSRLKQR